MKLTLLSLLIIAISCRNGADISQLYSDDTFTCFAQKGLSYVSVQAYLPYGGVAPRAQQNLRQARNRGFSTDIHMNFCNSKDPVAQVRDMLNAIPGSLFDTVWVRVEENSSPGCSLTLNTPQKSCDYLRAIVGYVEGKGLNVGIYSTILFWKKVFGTASFCYQVGKKPLWYGSDDGVASFAGFSTFGGWSYPNLKTYNYGSTICGTSVNLNWSPNSQLQKE